MRYAKPPIVEAVVGVRFGDALDHAVLQTVADRFLPRYPVKQDEQEHSFNFGPQGIQVMAGPAKARLTSDSGILIIGPDEFATSRLAPYPGWDQFSREVVQNLGLLRETTGFRTLVQLGVRFINRIDIPLEPGGSASTEVSRFLQIGPFIPAALTGNGMGNYFLSAQILHPTARVTIQTGQLPETLIAHTSVLLDIDVLCTSVLPQRVDALTEVLLDLRRIKNETFEACISDAARALFEVLPL